MRLHRALLFAILAFSFAPAIVSATRAIEISEAKLGKGVKDRMIVDEATTFAVNDRVYLWMKITGGPSDPIRVTWKTEDFSESDTDLTIDGDPWRTWSYKTVFKAGDWTVTVTDNAGAVLKELKFTVSAPSRESL